MAFAPAAPAALGVALALASAAAVALALALALGTAASFGITSAAVAAATAVAAESSSASNWLNVSTKFTVGPADNEVESLSSALMMGTKGSNLHTGHRRLAIDLVPLISIMGCKQASWNVCPHCKE